MVLVSYSPGYHEVVHDHFNNPRNVGSLDKEETSGGSRMAWWTCQCCPKNQRLDPDPNKRGLFGSVFFAGFSFFGISSYP